MALLSLLACACSSDDVSSDTVPVNDTQVSFILSLNNATNGTRASWGDGYAPQQVGDTYENNIDPEHLQVALYKDNQLAANVTILSHLPIESENPGEQLYRFIGSVNSVNGAELTSGEYKIMVFANCVSSDQSDLSVPSDLSDPSDPSALSYDYEAKEVKAGTQLIPMWGVTTATELKLKKGERDDVGEINLLRAFAKVEINLDPTIRGIYTITSATINNYNTKGYCLPAGYASVDKTVDLDQEDGTNSSFNPNHSPSQTALVFDYSEDKKAAYLYIPEYDNSTNPATITLELQDADRKTITGTLEFKDYANGAPTNNADAHDIVRNHIYRYIVNVEQGNLIVQAKVMPWQLVTSSIGWMPQPAPTDENPFDYGSDKYNKLVEKGFYILLPRQDFGYTDNGKKRETVKQVFHDLYEGVVTGDEEPNYCVIYYPRYTMGKKDHTTLETKSSGATFFFLLTGPEGATWEAHLTNNDDFEFVTSTPSSNYFADCTDKDEITGKTYEEEGSVSRVTHGIARKKPYFIEISCKNSYTAPGSGGGDTYFDDEYLTDWGKKHWNGQRVVDTEFYITVRLADGTEYELDINPPYTAEKAATTNFKDKRRYAGTDKRIWFRQLRAKKGWDYDELAKDISPSDTENFEWWRVNPYWKK